MKIGAVVLVLLAASAGPSAFAKAMNGHHAHHAAAKTASRHGAPAPQKGTANGAGDRNASGKIDGGGADVPVASRDTARSAKPPKLEIVKPDRASAPHLGVLVPSKPLVRNAIGQTATSSNLKPGGTQPEPRRTLRDVQPLRPGGNGSPAGRGKIDGATLIRPSVSASIGGPAKPAGGLNGTLFRPKHR